METTKSRSGVCASNSATWPELSCRQLAAALPMLGSSSAGSSDDASKQLLIAYVVFSSSAKKQVLDEQADLSTPAKPGAAHPSQLRVLLHWRQPAAPVAPQGRNSSGISASTSLFRISSKPSTLELQAAHISGDSRLEGEQDGC